MAFRPAEYRGRAGFPARPFFRVPARHTESSTGIIAHVARQEVISTLQAHRLSLQERTSVAPLTMFRSVAAMRAGATGAIELPVEPHAAQLRTFSVWSNRSARKLGSTSVLRLEYTRTRDVVPHDGHVTDCSEHIDIAYPASMQPRSLLTRRAALHLSGRPLRSSSLRASSGPSEGPNFVLNQIPEDVIVHTEITVNQDVSKAD